MKKLLLGSSALVAAGLISNGALAQTATTDTPIQIKLGGQYYAAAAAFVSDDDNPGQNAYKRQPTAVQDYFLLRFIGSTTFSNGITAGVWTRLNAFNAPLPNANTVSGFLSANNTTIKDTYVYVKNAASFGEFRLGDDSDVRRQIAVGNNAGVTGDGNLGANSAALQFLNSPVWNYTTLNLDGRGTKVEYYTPTISGFQLGVSYTPDKGGGHTNGPGNTGDNSGPVDNITNGLTASLLNQNTAYNYYSIGATWTGTFDGAKIAATAGYSSASRKNAYSGANAKTALGQNNITATLSSVQNANPQVYNVGFQTNYGPWEIGFDYELTSAIPGGLVGGAGQATAISAAGLVTATTNATNEEINKVLDLNLSYTIGAIRIGAEYSMGSFEGITGDANVKRAAINHEVQIGATYTAGPGVNLFGFIQQEIYDPNGPYIPTTGTAALSSGVANNNNVYAKDFASTAIIVGTAFKF